ncbi:S-locus-specific glycoprotein S13-like isoform X1 [Rutidosis leptorrhynchoides]|uniref:S-locus-specific glycoprotein S13-like isoform X1 n=1 Tax=Rutidosis leptorrhynchoides TaxID=125765 RepID=UPI003A98EBC3
MITFIIFTVLCTNFIINCYPAAAVSSFNVTDQLNFISQLFSPDQNFTLGFFTIPATNYIYLGIWYTTQDPSTKVWVANPSKPLVSNSSVLTIDPNTGKLIITDRGTNLVNVSDNQIGGTSNLIAVLEDNGNFQLKNETDNNRTLWQSFDYPRNVLLPGMKLGSDLKTGKNWNLTSWLSDDVPDSGAFSLSWEPNGENDQRLMIRRRGQPYWTSGNLSNQMFEFMSVNNPFSRYWYNLSYVYNNEERNFSYRAFNGVWPMWSLRPSGEIVDGDSSMIWSPEFCYGFDSGNGCVEGTNLPTCRGGDDKVSLLNGDFAPMTSSSVDYSPLSIGDCMERCWNDCGCLGFTTTSSNDTGCVTWTGTKSVNNFSVNPQGTSVRSTCLLPQLLQVKEKLKTGFGHQLLLAF